VAESELLRPGGPSFLVAGVTPPPLPAGAVCRPLARVRVEEGNPHRVRVRLDMTPQRCVKL